MRRTLNFLYGFGAWLAAACLAAMAVLILAQVVGRWFDLLVPAAEELAGYLMAATTFLALAYTLRSGNHIRVTLVIRLLDAPIRRWQELFVLGVTLLLSCLLAWSAVALVVESLAYGDTSSGLLAVPLWIPQTPMAVGLVVFTVALADELICTLRGGTARYLVGEAADAASARVER